MNPAERRRRQRLIKRIATMISNHTYNDAPINYTIAEKAIEMVERSQVRTRYRV